MKDEEEVGEGGEQWREQEKRKMKYGEADEHEGDN